MKIAAIQLDAVFADVKSNLIQSQKYIKEAALSGAELVVLPEFFTSAIGFSNCMLDVAVQNNNTHNILVNWALKHNVAICGSYISFQNDNAFNLFELVLPNGKVFTHKKDIPTQFENCYYANGDTDNVLITPIGRFGVALCWEMIRYDTLRRMFGQVDAVLAGSCWWDLPEDAPPERDQLRQYNQKLALESPVTFAKLLGVPVIHASHCGRVTANNFPHSDKLQTRRFVGGAQIIGEDGVVIRRKEFSSGSGFVISDVLIKNKNNRKSAQLPPDYWIPDLPESYLNAWNTVNPAGKQYYNSVALPYYKNQSKI